MAEPYRDSPYLYLTTTGWKTGKAHRIEIWFVERQAKYYLAAETRDKAHWVQNIRHRSAVMFEVGGQTFHGAGRVIDPAQEPDLAVEIRALMDAKCDWSDGLIVELASSL